MATPGHGPRRRQHRVTAQDGDGALGVVYGDIGTSPLYAMRECFNEEYGIAVTRGNVMGILSLIFWALTLIVSLKYVAYVLRRRQQGRRRHLGADGASQRGDARQARLSGADRARRVRLRAALRRRRDHSRHLRALGPSKVWRSPRPRSSTW